MDMTSPPSSSPDNLKPRKAQIPFAALLTLLAICVCTLHLNGLRTRHAGGDERIFYFLAEKLRQNPFDYSIRGELTGENARRFIQLCWEPECRRKLDDVKTADVLKTPPDINGRQTWAYDPARYDTPTFHHPPLYAAALAMFSAVFGSGRAVLLSGLMHTLAVVLIALIGRRLFSDRTGLVAAAILATEPTSWICGEQLVADGMLQATVTLAVYAAIQIAANNNSLRAYILSGALLGLAGWVKLPAAMAAPAVALAWLLLPTRGRPNKRAMLMGACTAMLVVLPWIIYYRCANGNWVPDGKPTELMMTLAPYTRMVADRSWNFYIVGILLTAPALTMALCSFFRGGLRDRGLLVLWAWAFVWIAGFTLVGVRGLGLQLRYLAPAMPALALLAAVGAERCGRTIQWAIVPLCIYSLNVGVTQALRTVPDVFPSLLFKFIFDISGWNPLVLFSRMWWW